MISCYFLGEFFFIFVRVWRGQKCARWRRVFRCQIFRSKRSKPLLFFVLKSIKKFFFFPFAVDFCSDFSPFLSIVPSFVVLTRLFLFILFISQHNLFAVSFHPITPKKSSVKLGKKNSKDGRKLKEASNYRLDGVQSKWAPRKRASPDWLAFRRRPAPFVTRFYPAFFSFCTCWNCFSKFYLVWLLQTNKLMNRFDFCLDFDGRIGIELSVDGDLMASQVQTKWSVILSHYAGIASVALVGLLLALAVPVAGLVVCFCRCAGNRQTNKPTNKQAHEWIDTLKRSNEPILSCYSEKTLVWPIFLSFTLGLPQLVGHDSILGSSLWSEAPVVISYRLL